MKDSITRPLIVGILAAAIGRFVSAQPPTTPQWGAYQAPAIPRRTPSAPPAAPGPTAADTHAGSVRHATVTRAVRLPQNLFSLPDAAVVQLPGRSASAGDVKRRLRTALAAQAHSPKTMTISRTIAGRPNQAPVSWGGSASTRSSWGGASPRRTIGLQPAGPFAVRPAATTAQTEAAGTPSNLLPATQAGTASMLCRRSPPRVRAVGALTSGAQFQVAGDCFGTKMGAVEIAGNLPNGRIDAPILKWQAGLIVAEMPPISGFGSGVVTVTVVDGAGVRSADANARFLASQQRIEVSSRWTPSSHYRHDEVDPVEHEDWGPDPALYHANSATFQIAVNPQCALDTMQVVMRDGTYLSETGFENGPPNSSTATINVQESCIAARQVTDVLGAPFSVSYSDAYCGTEYDLQAFAYCPVGVSP